jgi:hypothetical protein
MKSKKIEKNDFFNEFNNKVDEQMNNSNINSECPNSSVRNSSQKNAVNNAIQNSNIINNDNYNGGMLKGETFYIGSKNENKIIQKKEVNKEVTEKNEEKSGNNEKMDFESLFDVPEQNNYANLEDQLSEVDLGALNSTEKNNIYYNLNKIENEYSQESNNYTENNIDNKTHTIIKAPQKDN